MRENTKRFGTGVGLVTAIATLAASLVLQAGPADAQTTSGSRVTARWSGAVDTRIRYRGYNAQGGAAGASGLKEDDLMSVEECARLIVEGMERRQREVVMTAKGKVGRFLKLLAPGVVEDMALKALKEDARPR